MKDLRETQYQKIQKVAAKIFLEKGYTGTTIREITAKADLSPGSLYNYFKSKKELFDSLDLVYEDRIPPKKQKKRAKILHAALVLFGEYGYEGVTMDHIAKSAGCPRATLYQYCKSKEDLFSQVLQESSFNLFTKQVMQAHDQSNFYDVIKSIGKSYLEIADYPERVALLRSVIRDSKNFPELGLLYYENGFQAACNNVVEYLEEVLPQKGISFSRSDLMTRVHTYIGSLQSYIIMSSVIFGIPLKISRDDYLSISTETFLKSISCF